MKKLDSDLMNIVLPIVFFILVILIIVVCMFRPQNVAKNFGGNMTVDLPADTKLEEITWKDDSLWYLTRPMRDDEEAEVHTFQQSSNFGVFEGTVTIVEHKSN